MFRVDAAHIQDWIARHDALVEDQSEAAAFATYLNGPPWTPSRLRWSKIRHAVFEIVPGWESKIEAEVSNAPVGGHTHLMFMFGPKEPVLVAPTLAGIRDVDLIYSAAPGARYFCGADFRDGQITATHADFGEFDGFGTLSFRI